MPRAFATVALLVLALAGCAGGRPAPDFRLQDDSSVPWLLSQQRGKAVLLTFGFTHCSDTCPAILGKLAHLTAALHDRSDGVEIVFITVDPARDSPLVLHRYLRRFALPGASPLIGLTGTRVQIEKVARDYHVYFQALPAGNVAHSAVVYVIDSHGRLRATLDDDDSEHDLLAAVVRALA